MERNKSILKKHYDEIYSPFKPMINHPKSKTGTPDKKDSKKGYIRRYLGSLGLQATKY